MSKSEPMPCPFYGGPAELWWTGLADQVRCDNREKCGAEGPKRKTEHGAVSAWNRGSAAVHKEQR